MINSLAAFLQHRRIGVIHRLVDDRHRFVFEQDYIDQSQRPILSLSFEDQTGKVDAGVSSRRLHPFFSNLLPEGDLLLYLARQTGVEPKREYFLLAALGADLPGAVTAAPLEADDSVRDFINNLAPRFSLAGVQLKFSATLGASGALTLPEDGIGGDWIIKLPGADFPALAENEYASLELARAVGINVPLTRLIDVANIGGLPIDLAHLKKNALAIKRFDRGPGGELIHAEDFCQVFGLFPHEKYHHASYSNIASVLSAQTGEAGVYEFVRRLAFSVLIGNGDMHLKNWSLLYPDGRTPVLSPAYDLLCTTFYLPGDRLALTFGESRSLSEISPAQIRRFARKARLPVSSVSKIVIETVERTVSAWDKLEQKELLPLDLGQALEKQIYRVAANTRLGKLK